MDRWGLTCTFRRRGGAGVTRFLVAHCGTRIALVQEFRKPSRKLGIPVTGNDDATLLGLMLFVITSINRAATKLDGSRCPPSASESFRWASRLAYGENPRPTPNRETWAFTPTGLPGS